MIITVFPLWPACISIDLDKKLATYPLIQLAFSYSFFYGLKFINLKFSKTCHTQEQIPGKYNFFSSQNKIHAKISTLKYAMFLSEILPLSFRWIRCFLCIFSKLPAVSSLFSLLKKGSCKIREMKLQNVSKNEFSFLQTFPTNVFWGRPMENK